MAEVAQLGGGTNLLEGYEEVGRQIIGDSASILGGHSDPRMARLRGGSSAPLAKGLALSAGARGSGAARPADFRVGGGEVSLQPPPARPPRNQRKFLAVGRGAAKRRPSPWPEEREEGALLDGFALLDACQVEEPEEAVQAVLEGCGLSSAVASDFAFFTQLTHLDLGDNRLQLGQLAGLPALLELHLDCNGVRSVALPSGGFARLEVLNLAYNALTVDAVASLAQLPCLRELDLTANQLNALPADWASFLELRRLVLDRNELGADEDLIALGTTPYLKELSLASNRFERIPEGALLHGGLGEVEALSLAQNRVAHEDALVPVLQMPRLRSLAVWGNPFLRRAVPPAFEEVLTERGVSLGVRRPDPPARLPAYEHAAVRGRDSVVNSHRPAEVVMRTLGAAARAAPAQPQGREDAHIARARAQVAMEAALSAAHAAPEAGARLGGRSGGGLAPAGGAVRPGSPRASLRRLQDSLLLSDEAEALVDPSTDVRTAVAALRHALRHPLAAFDADAPTHHQSSTAAREAGRRAKFAPRRDPPNLAPRAGGHAGRELARHLAIEQAVDGVLPRLDSLRRALKVAEVGGAAAGGQPAACGGAPRGGADPPLQGMLSVLRLNNGVAGVGR